MRQTLYTPANVSLGIPNDGCESESEDDDDLDAKSVAFTATDSDYEMDVPSGSELDMEVDDDDETDSREASSCQDIHVNSNDESSEDDSAPPRAFRPKPRRPSSYFSDDDDGEGVPHVPERSKPGDQPMRYASCLNLHLIESSPNADLLLS